MKILGFSGSLIIVTLLLYSTVTAQNVDFMMVGEQRLAQEQFAMTLLLGWGGANMIGGGLIALNGSHRDFGLMTAGWGLVNAGIAIFALIGADSYTQTTTYQQVLQDEQLFNRILAVNSGLNIGYIATGFAMNYLGSSSRVRQFGTAVMIQGAFLMGFDAWLLLSSNARLSELVAVPIVTAVEGLGMIPGFSFMLRF